MNPRLTGFVTLSDFSCPIGKMTLKNTSVKCKITGVVFEDLLTDVMETNNMY